MNGDIISQTREKIEYLSTILCDIISIYLAISRKLLSISLFSYEGFLFE